MFRYFCRRRYDETTINDLDDYLLEKILLISIGDVDHKTLFSIRRTCSRWRKMILLQKQFAIKEYYDLREIYNYFTSKITNTHFVLKRITYGYEDLTDYIKDLRKKGHVRALYKFTWCHPIDYFLRNRWVVYG